MLRTDHDLQAALLTLAPDPDTDASVINAVHRKIARRRTTIRATVVATSAAAVGVAASLVLAFAPSASHLGRSDQFKVSAPVELRTLSKVAAIQPLFRMPGPGQFYYTDTREYGRDCLGGRTIYHDSEYQCAVNMLSVMRTQSWIAANGSGRILGTTISTRFASPRDRARWVADGRRPKLNANNYDERDGKHQDAIGEPGLGKLPTDQVKLAKVIHDRKWEGGPAGPGEDFVQVGDLLRLPNASPKLRAAAFEVGARIPGVKSLGTRTFHGVTGATIGITSRSRNHEPFYKGSYVTDELIFDRATSTLKAEVYLIIKDGKLINSGGTTYLTSGLVNSTHSAPGH
jgi:hypothetical protein